MALAVWANALAVLPADDTMTVPPPQSLRRAKVGSASISLNVQERTLPPLSGWYPVNPTHRFLSPSSFDSASLRNAMGRASVPKVDLTGSQS